MATKPTIILIPGIWEGPKVYSEVSSSLSALSYPTKSLSLPSTGTTSDSKISMHDDIASIRSDIAPLIENENQDLILVCHSAAGYLGSGAIEGLGWKQRQANGLKGGVKRLVFVAAGLADVGYVHENRPFMEIDETAGIMMPKSPLETLFNDLPAAEAARWISQLQTQPASGWNDTTRYSGWKDVPSTFLICEKDAILPKEMQEHFAKAARSKVVTCESGHCPMLSMPNALVDVIVEAAEEA